MVNYLFPCLRLSFYMIVYDIVIPRFIFNREIKYLKKKKKQPRVLAIKYLFNRTYVLPDKITIIFPFN